uniref:Uncharacterized protein n=1 Tax=Lepeophtheirus salmonis TaxID=72036 RepID=A0A0K2TA50_LEPSM
MMTTSLYNLPSSIQKYILGRCFRVFLKSRVFDCVIQSRRNSSKYRLKSMLSLESKSPPLSTSSHNFF